MMRKVIQVVSLGTKSYKDAFRIQEQYAAELIRSSIQNGQSQISPQKLLLVEHHPVYTVGIRQNTFSKLEIDKLQNTGAEFHHTNRGGLITFHGPGQLVAYPIIYLKNFGLGIRSYVCKLEKTIISTCQHFGISAHITPDTGVWIEDRKIAAIGIHGRRYVTTHGIALNCDTDLSWFDHIVPCGLEGKGVTSLTKETGRKISITDTIKPFCESFKDLFHCELEYSGSGFSST